MEANAQFLGAGHSMQWPLTLASAALTGFAIALPFGRFIPRGRSLRIGVTAVLGLAGSPIGMMIVSMAAFIAPLAAVALLIWSVTRLSGRAIMEDSMGEEFKHFSMELEFLLRRTPKWRETAEGILIKTGDIVRRGKAAEESAVG